MAPRPFDAAPSGTSWPSEFTEGQPQARRIYNQTCLDNIEENWKRSEAEDAASVVDEEEREDDGIEYEVNGSAEEVDNDSTEGEMDVSLEIEEPSASPANSFLKGLKKAERTKIKLFCGDCSEQDLRRAFVDPPNMFLREYSVLGQTRENSGALNSGQYCEVARLPRFAVTGPGTSSSCPGSTPGLTITEISDSDRKETRVRNVNPLNVVALMKTVSVHEAEPLAELLSRHLSQKSDIAVSLSSSGLLFFSLYLAVPSYFLATRHPASPYPGQRPDENSPAYHLIPSLGQKPRTMWLVRTQASLMLTGFDDNHWALIRLVDSYEEDEPEGDMETWDSDPVPTGKEKTTCDPRLTFLLTLKTDIQKALTDQGDAVDHYRSKVNWMRQHSKHVDLNELPSLKGGLDDLVECLAEHEDVWNRFVTTDIRYFRDSNGFNDAEASLIARLLNEIWSIYARLKTRHVEAGRTLKRLKEFEEGLRYMDNETRSLSAVKLQERQVILQGQLNRLTEGEINNQQGLQKLTYISIWSLPVLVVSSLFSMQGNTLPFSGNTAAFAWSLVLAIGCMVILLKFSDTILQKLKGTKSKVPWQCWQGMWTSWGSLFWPQQPRAEDIESHRVNADAQRAEREH